MDQTEESRKETLTNIIMISVAVVLLIIFLASCFGYNFKSYSDYSSSSSFSSTKSTQTCGYKYPDGSVCGAKCGSHAPLCDKHFNELNSTYEEVVGHPYD